MTDIHAQRRVQLRDLCLLHGLDGALVFASRRSQVTYFTSYRPGFLSNWSALWVGRAQESLATNFPFDCERASQASGMHVAAASRPIDVIPDGVRRVGLVTRDLVVDECPRSLLEDLSARGIAWVDIADSVIDWRSVPTPGEVESARAAARLCDRAFRELQARPAECSDDYSVVGFIEGYVRSREAAQALCLVGLGDGSVVTEPLGRPRRPGDIVSLELTLLLDSMWTQANWTFAPDGMTADNRLAAEACWATRARLMSALRPGATAGRVFHEGVAAMEEFGLDPWIEYDFGHGVGPHTPELPRLTRESEDLIAEGNVVAVHAAVRSPTGPTWFVGGPVAVTSAGCEELVPDAVWVAPTEGKA